MKKLFVMGIKANEEKFNELYFNVNKAKEINNGYDENSQIFWLNQQWNSINGYFINGEENPTGLIIGYLLYDEFFGNLVFNKNDKIDLKVLERAMDNFNKANNNFNYDKIIKKFLETEDEIKLYKIETNF